MQTFAEAFDFLAGLPSIIGPVLAATILVLATNWRWSITALLVQYALVALALSHSVRPEVAVIKGLVGVLVVMILYVSARAIPEPTQTQGREFGARSLLEEDGRRVFRLSVGWLSGPLGLPLRILAVLLMALGVVHVLGQYNSPLVTRELAFVACWLGGMGVLGLVLSSNTLRVALSVLTILSGFDLVYAALEPSLTMVGFWSAFMLLASLAFSYVIVVEGAVVPEEKES